MKDVQQLTQSRGLWPIDWRYFYEITKRVWWTADSTGSRATIALASMLWAIALLLNPLTLERPAYAMVRVLPWWVWCSGFALHAALGFWRIYERKERRGWATFVNALGFTLWTSMTIGSTITLGELPGGSALEWVVCVRLAVITARSGLNYEATTA